MKTGFDIPPAKSWRMNKNRTCGWRQKARLVTWSIVTAAPTGMQRWAPYIVGIVELKNGERMMTQIVGVEVKELKKGLKCVGVMRRLFEVSPDQVIIYGVVFEIERE